MVKVVGPVCNLDCDYCYYLEKSALYPEKKLNLSSFRMKEEMLEKFIRDYICSQPQERIEFIWHGGEPTLAGLDYFRKIIVLQQKYSEGKQITNVLQTNGTLITDEWAEFLARHQFCADCLSMVPGDFMITTGGLRMVAGHGKER